VDVYQLPLVEPASPVLEEVLAEDIELARLTDDELDDRIDAASKK
jgi:hypothetical protein